MQCPSAFYLAILKIQDRQSDISQDHSWSRETYTGSKKFILTYIWLQSRLAGYRFHLFLSYWISAKNTSDFITHLRNIITLFMSYIANRHTHPSGSPLLNSDLICRGHLAHQTAVLASCFRLLGFRISLSRVLTIWPNLGRSLRFFSQQSNMSWWRTTGQSIGAGSL